MYWVYDDTGFIEINTEDGGWQPISCPFLAIIDGYCPAGVAQWGGFDNDRVLNQIVNGDAERFSPELQAEFTVELIMVGKNILHKDLDNLFVKLGGKL